MTTICCMFSLFIYMQHKYSNAQEYLYKYTQVGVFSPPIITSQWAERVVGFLE